MPEICQSHGAPQLRERFRSEYDLYGVQPDPGSTTAAIIGIRLATVCHRAATTSRVI